MGKKVLVLAGSPRKGGNSDVLCEAFMRGASEAGHTVEKIYIHDLHLNPCQACYACRGTGKCIHKDNMPDIMEKMIAADILVLATPVYFYSMSGQMKTFIDRTLPRWRDISNKDCYFIATAADEKELLETTMEALRGFTDCLPGAKVKGKIYGDGFYQPGTIAGSITEQNAYEMGKNT